MRNLRRAKNFERINLLVATFISAGHLYRDISERTIMYRVNPSPTEH